MSVFSPEMSTRVTKEGLAKTVFHMATREVRRESSGNFKKSQVEELWTLLLILTFAMLVGAVAYGANGIQYFLDTWQELGLITFAFPIAIFVTLKLSLVLRWVFYWLVVATLILFLVNSFELPKDYAAEVGKYVFFGFAIVEGLTVIVYLWIKLLLPYLLINFLLKKDALRWWGVEEHTKIGHFKRKYWWGSYRRFSYIGETNESCQPHGVGAWTSEWQMGEILTGKWENGIPVGPFRSQEYLTGYSFSNLRIGFVATDAAGFQGMSFNVTNGLCYGVASVECSISGKFFNDLPHAKMIIDPYMGNVTYRLRDTLNSLIHYDELNVGDAPKRERITVLYDPIKGFSVEGFRRLQGRTSNNIQISCETGAKASLRNQVSIDGWVRSNDKEVLLYIPGFNCTMEEACETLGQMLTLGNLPAKVKPLIFGWPGGSLFLYKKAIQHAECERTVSDFLKVISELIEAGISRIHILCHSMGARVVVRASSHFGEYFYQNSNGSIVFNNSSSNAKAELLSVSFMNPETSVKAFKETQYQNIRMYTSLITVYVNRKDIALMASEYIFTRQRMIGRRANELYYLDHDDIDVESPVNREIMDIDVIDTTEVDANVHAARHSYHSLNKFIVDDVVEIMCTRKRASERSHRLLNIKNNIYGFLSAPSFVVKQ
jgi:esterase/lipase superfamily enzyme